MSGEKWERLDEAFSQFINAYGDPYEPIESYEMETARNIEELYKAFNEYRLARSTEKRNDT